MPFAPWQLFLFYFRVDRRSTLGSCSSRSLTNVRYILFRSLPSSDPPFLSKPSKKESSSSSSWVWLLCLLGDLRPQRHPTPKLLRTNEPPPNSLDGTDHNKIVKNSKHPPAVLVHLFFLSPETARQPQSNLSPSPTRDSSSRGSRHRTAGSRHRARSGGSAQISFVDPESVTSARELGGRVVTRVIPG